MCFVTGLASIHFDSVDRTNEPEPEETPYEMGSYYVSSVFLRDRSPHSFHYNSSFLFFVYAGVCMCGCVKYKKIEWELLNFFNTF